MLRKGWLVAACLAALTISTHDAQAGGHVYALRGLINVFSYGMDAMVEKSKARGIRASAHGHGEFPALAAEAAKLAKSGKGPIVIIGHSLGADAAVYMANEMKTLGAPVALLVLFGPTIDLAIPSNVRQVVNYYQANSAWRGRAVKGDGFRGSINNINLDKAEDVTHFNIEKLERLQNQAMAKITALTGTGRPLPSATASASPMTTTDAPMSVATPPTRGAASSSPAPSQRSARRADASKPAIETPTHHGASY
jgi:thioesterase domain-containing protein